MTIEPQGILYIVIGLFMCLAGYSIFKSMLPLWGFVLIGFIAFNIVPGLFHWNNLSVWALMGIFVVGGTIGALLARPLYYVIIFLTGAAMGGMIGYVVGTYLTVSGGTPSLAALNAIADIQFPPSNPSTLSLVLAAVLGLTTGGLAVAFQKFMIAASTAFVGSAMLVTGVNTGALQILNAGTNRAIWILVGWLVLGLIGLFLQLRMGDEN